MYSRKKFENLVQTQGRTFFFTDSQRANNLRFHYKTLNSRLFVECNFIYFIIEWKKKIAHRINPKHPRFGRNLKFEIPKKIGHIVTQTSNIFYANTENMWNFFKATSLTTIRRV